MTFRRASVVSSRRGVVVELYTHTGLLRFLTSEDIDGGRLSNLGSAINHLASLVEDLDIDDDIVIAHDDVLNVHLEFIP
jgi:hypothetical protein